MRGCCDDGVHKWSVRYRRKHQLTCLKSLSLVSVLRASKCKIHLLCGIGHTFIGCFSFCPLDEGGKYL